MPPSVRGYEAVPDNRVRDILKVRSVSRTRLPELSRHRARSVKVICMLAFVVVPLMLASDEGIQPPNPKGLSIRKSVSVPSGVMLAVKKNENVQGGSLTPVPFTPILPENRPPVCEPTSNIAAHLQLSAVAVSR